MQALAEQALDARPNNVLDWLVKLMDIVNEQEDVESGGMGMGGIDG